LGGGGNDTLQIENGTVDIDAGEGNDLINVNGGSQHTLAGGLGSDTVYIDGHVQWLEAGNGDDVVFAGENGSWYLLQLGHGDDVFFGGNDNDFVMAMRGTTLSSGALVMMLWTVVKVTTP